MCVLLVIRIFLTYKFQYYLVSSPSSLAPSKNITLIKLFVSWNVLFSYQGAYGRFFLLCTTKRLVLVDSKRPLSTKFKSYFLISDILQNLFLNIMYIYIDIFYLRSINYLLLFLIVKNN